VGYEVAYTGERTIYAGRRIRLVEVQYVKNGELYTKEVVRHPGAVVILPLVEDTVILEKQYRPALGKWIIELPAGTLEPGERPEDAARRELLEETGFYAESLTRLGILYASPGYSDEELHAFLALNPVYRGRSPESYEAIEILRLPLGVFEEMMRRGEIRDAKTLATYALYMLKHGRRQA